MKILISACLTGIPCRYDGKDKNSIDLTELKKQHELFPVCPEVLGGLPTPRTPAEIVNGRVINRDKNDVSEEFTKGALTTLDIAKKNKCTVAILKAKSPSCGSGMIYDGSFTSTLTHGDGITAKLLKDAGITVYTEEEISALIN